MDRSQQFTVRCPSGLRSTPGKCVSVNSVSRVRIPLSPPYTLIKSLFLKGFFYLFREITY